MEHSTRTPLMKPEWLATIHRMREHPDAPRWNIEIGDRLTAEDLAYAKSFGETLAADRARPASSPTDDIVAWIEEAGSASRTSPASSTALTRGAISARYRA